MRRARQDERAALAALMFDQFYEKEELQQQFSGVDGQTARRFGPAVLGIGQGYYFTRGDVFVCDGANGTPIGAIVGADPRRLSRFGPLGQLLYALQNGKMLRNIPRPLLAQLTRNSRPVMDVHSTKWYRRYCKHPYYIAQFGVDKTYRGSGAARELLDGVIAYAAAQGYPAVVLETLSRENVPMYLHFGFFLKQVYTCGAFTEYRLLKYLPQHPSQKA